MDTPPNFTRAPPYFTGEGVKLVASRAKHSRGPPRFVGAPPHFRDEGEKAKGRATELHGRTGAPSWLPLSAKIPRATPLTPPVNPPGAHGSTVRAAGV
jgi:hypothetical protein